MTLASLTKLLLPVLLLGCALTTASAHDCPLPQERVEAPAPMVCKIVTSTADSAATVASSRPMANGAQAVVREDAGTTLTLPVLPLMRRALGNGTNRVTPDSMQLTLSW